MGCIWIVDSHFSVTAVIGGITKFPNPNRMTHLGFADQFQLLYKKLLRLRTAILNTKFRNGQSAMRESFTKVADLVERLIQFYVSRVEVFLLVGEFVRLILMDGVNNPHFSLGIGIK